MKMLHQGNLNLFLDRKEGFNYPVHLHNAVELVLVKEGQTTATYGNKRIELRAGDIFVVFPNQIHGYEDSPGVRGYCMGIPMTPYLSGYQRLLEMKEPVDPVLHLADPEVSKLAELIVEAACVWKQLPHNIMESMHQGYILLIIGKLLQLMPLTDSRPQDGDVVRLLLQYLNEHYHEPLSRRDVAKAIGYHESYISHIFSQALNLTLSEYLTVLRINDAKRLLTESRQSISQIAMSLGFGSIRSFNRTFSSKLHMNPTAYRASGGRSGRS
ncbi:MAG: helix-turn-helix transcriptional regulator [Oscillospiraceae bacterium]|nr:helix-turn-helix transcriptional regulator [Oscillospiraceae bacterium]